MRVHVSARVAWHADGWDGRICRDPAANTYCVGANSYPGQYIAEKRSLEWETECAGQPCGSLDRIPPCCYSHNAFGTDGTLAEAAPPHWFNDGTETRRWELPPATVCVWPYEVMYGEDVRRDRGYDHHRRLAKAREYFDAVAPDDSLIFYYANYSNPFSEDEARRYALVGMSRVKALGPELFYEGCSDSIKERYGGGYVWQRAITSHYPDQGLRVPYHAYRDQPEVLARIVLFPENPRLCKYATRHLSDDDALGLVEGFLRVVRELQTLGDASEDWSRRVRWLEQLIAELWQHRGLLPGMPGVLAVLSLHGAIPAFKARALEGKEVETADALFSLLDGRMDDVAGIALDARAVRSARRQWRLRTDEDRRLLREVLPRFALGVEQIKKVLAENRAQNGIRAGSGALADNPYLLSEQYHGDGPDDCVPWGTIDRGMIPSPELPGEALVNADDERRFRGLVVDALRCEEKHVFVPAGRIIEAVNRRLSVLPEWKRFVFHERYLDADKDFISQAVELRRDGEQTYLYLRDVFEDERFLEKKLSFLIGGPDIPLRAPVTTAAWNAYLFDAESVLARRAQEEYHAAIRGQVDACQRVFVRPLGVLSGEAGTGKTTVIRALVKAIKRGHGAGSSVIALAPTGKAADRIRAMVESDDALRGRIEVTTVHSFLAKRGWLNPNLTFKRADGQVAEEYKTYILDECSMLDLALTAAFFRAVRWPTVQRLILVGDPNQLPPIGRGRVFADIIDYVGEQAPESVARLKHNLRQLQGRVEGNATGIIDLARCYRRVSHDEAKDEDVTTAAERTLQRVQAGGDVAPDLRVLYWQDQEDLSRMLLDQMVNDMTEDVRGRKEEPSEDLPSLWRQAHENNRKPTYFQVLTPYRGEFFGVEELNRLCQEHVRGRRPTGNDALDGVMLFDKVIQIRNRPQSRPIQAWNHEIRATETVEVFNGQIGFVWPHLFDNTKWKSTRFNLTRFRVSFERRDGYSVGYGADLGKGTNGRWLPQESVEENLELAYAISVHKAQGSEFDRVFVVVPKSKQTLLSSELFYTALTRARLHCTLLVEQDMSPLLGMRRPEASRLRKINSSLFEFRVVPDALLSTGGWFEDGRFHHTLGRIAVRSKSEVIIANLLHDRDIPFRYEQPLYASDGSFYLPDFTVTWRGKDYFWEHVGMLHREDYRAHWKTKRAWYEKNFPGCLIVTEESSELSPQADEVIRGYFT